MCAHNVGAHAACIRAAIPPPSRAVRASAACAWAHRARAAPQSACAIDPSCARSVCARAHSSCVRPECTRAQHLWLLPLLPGPS
eukprot:2203689-Pleurochrysis_carterae.AAC.1